MKKNYTKIPWAERTWNFIGGCTKVSEGCMNCYAINMSNRLASIGIDLYKGVVSKKKSGLEWSGKINIASSKKKVNIKKYFELLHKPFTWKQPSIIFVESMGDLFHESVPFEFIKEVIDVIRFCPQHKFIICTKRTARMKKFFNDYLPKQQMLYYHNPNGIGFAKNFYRNYQIPQNLCLLITVENIDKTKHVDLVLSKRIIDLLSINGVACRGLSIEPMLGSIDLKNINILINQIDSEFHKYLYGSFNAFTGLGKGHETDILNRALSGIYDDLQSPIKIMRNKLDWVIVGAESGHKKRICEHEWIEDMIDDCIKYKVPVFVKQIHKKKNFHSMLKNLKDYNSKSIIVENDFDLFPYELRIRQYPKMFNK
jgi:protein gp37